MLNNSIIIDKLHNTGFILESVTNEDLIFKNHKILIKVTKDGMFHNDKKITSDYLNNIHGSPPNYEVLSVGNHSVICDVVRLIFDIDILDYYYFQIDNTNYNFNFINFDTQITASTTNRIIDKVKYSYFRNIKNYLKWLSITSGRSINGSTGEIEMDP